jgi:hypothetical protein
MSYQKQIDDIRNNLQSLINNAKKISGYNKVENPDLLDKIPLERNSDGERFFINLGDISQAGSIKRIFIKANILFKLFYENFSGVEVGVDLKSTLGKKTINEEIFNFHKRPVNNDPLLVDTIQAGDFITNGWWDNNTFIVRAEYVSGDINTLSSWNVILDEYYGE